MKNLMRKSISFLEKQQYLLQQFPDNKQDILNAPREVVESRFKSIFTVKLNKN